MHIDCKGPLVSIQMSKHLFSHEPRSNAKLSVWHKCYGKLLIYWQTHIHKKHLPRKHGIDGNYMSGTRSMVRVKQSGAQFPGYRWLSACYHDKRRHYSRKNTEPHWLRKEPVHKISPSTLTFTAHLPTSLLFSSIIVEVLRIRSAININNSQE